jgi:hypothetical protein
MAPLDTTEQEDRKPAATPKGQRFWAIRKCDSLKSPAIFTDWDDCSFYVDQSENDCKLAYKEFDSGLEALNYLFRMGLDLPSGDAAAAPPAAAPTPPVPATTAAAASVSYAQAPAAPTATPWNPIMPAGGFWPHAPVGGYLLPTATANPGMVSVPAYTESPASKRKATEDPAAVGDSGPLPSYKRKRSTALPDKKWDAKFQHFLDFKEEFGDANLTQDRIRSNDKWKKLERWNTQERSRIRDYLQDPNCMSFADGDKARKLLSAGFQLKTSKYIESWETNYQKLKAFKEEHGNLELSSKKAGCDRSLKVWLYQQKAQLLNYETPNVHSRLSADRAGRLKQIGLDAKDRNVEKAPEAVRKVFEDKLKALQGTINTPHGFIPAAEIFGTQQDASVGQQERGSSEKNATTETQVEDAAGVNKEGTATSTTSEPTTDAAPATGSESASDEKNAAAALASFPESPMPSSASSGLAKKDQRWEENFQRLKEYKEIYGTCDLIKNTLKSERFHRRLSNFVSYERGRIQRFRKQEKENPALVLEKDREKVQRLLDLGFVMERGSEATEQATKLFGTPLLVWSEKRTAMWEANLELLKQYKEQHGTCDMNKQNDGHSAHLDTWITEQCRQLRMFEKKSERCNLDEEKMTRLKELGLTTAPRLKPGLNYVGTWEEMCDRLKQFKAEHGHVTVPSLPRTALRNWIVNQREQFERMKAGGKSQMTTERLSLLQQLGLPMRTGERKGFDGRATEWLEYKTKHGKEPPTGSSGPLGTWVRKTRSKYAMKQQGIETNLTQEQIDQLTSWGFRWSAGFKKPEHVAPSKSWDERLQELLKYKEQNGHVNVPQAYPVLGNFVHRQRKEFSQLKRGLKSTMTPARIEKLRSIGFVFLTRKSPLEGEKKRREIELGLVDPDEQDDDSSGDEGGMNMNHYW